MKALAPIVLTFLTRTASACLALRDRLIAPAAVRLVEQADGGFRITPSSHPDEAVSLDDPALAALIAGKRAEMVLLQRRFLFRPLELPPGAAPFLGGIVRAQIDRLTPWTAADAVFGHSDPTAAGDGIVTTVAATMHNVVAPFLAAIAGCRPAAIAILAIPHDGAAPIRVLDQRAQGRLDPARLGRAMGFVLGAMVLASGIMVVADSVMADRLAARQDELGRQIARRRIAQRAGDTASPLAALERRKHDTAASVVILETLSHALPDHTFLTELHLAAGRLQIAGLTRDAPSLIPRLEQSRRFIRATFYAPTTRAASDAGDRFHIETQVATGAVAP